MGDAYPELRPELGRIQKVAPPRGAQFSHTLTAGLKQLEACDVSGGTLAGAEIFKLYDTFGFPVDLVEDWCKERDLALRPGGLPAGTGRAEGQGPRRHEDPRRAPRRGIWPSWRTCRPPGSSATSTETPRSQGGGPLRRRPPPGGELSGARLRGPGQDALLRRKRRPGGRSRRAALEFGGGHRLPVRLRRHGLQGPGAQAPCALRERPDRRPDGGNHGQGRGRHRAAGAASGPTTRPPTCCTRPCARCWAPT